MLTDEELAFGLNRQAGEERFLPANGREYPTFCAVINPDTETVIYRYCNPAQQNHIWLKQPYYQHHTMIPIRRIITWAQEMEVHDLLTASSPTNTFSENVLVSLLGTPKPEHLSALNAETASETG